VDTLENHTSISGDLKILRMARAGRAVFRSPPEVEHTETVLTSAG